MIKGDSNLEQIKLVALDLDGTLLDNNLEISPRTRKAIFQLTDNGVYVCLVSGRTYRSTEFIREQLGIEMPVVAYDGGKIVIPEKNEIFSQKIPLYEALKAIRYGEERNLYVKVYIDDVLYIREPDKKSIAFSKTRHINYKVVGKLSENIESDVNMIVMYYNEKTPLAIDGSINNIDAEITASVSNSIDIIPKGVSKEEALKTIGEHLHVKRENMLAMGNGLNDLGMIKYAGIGIAMKNSNKGLLNNWDRVSQYTNNEDGVYHVIKRIINKKD